jgi:hypothetical protein
VKGAGRSGDTLLRLVKILSISFVSLCIGSSKADTKPVNQFADSIKSGALALRLARAFDQNGSC